jgi:glycosyltransferase involved in cell wall biosynthesis
MTASTVDPVACPHLSVVIPAFNEETRLPPSLRRMASYMRDHEVDWELLVVDDGSTDATSQVASDFLREHQGLLLRNPKNQGKGFSVRRGVLAARGRWVLITDADLSAPIEEHATLARAARDGALDVAIGSRGLPDSRIEVRQHPVRQSMGRVFNRLMRLMTGLPFRDTQCGFKLLDRRRCRPIFEAMVVNRFAFDVEFLFLCLRSGLRVAEVPIVWRNVEHSRVRVLSDSLNMLADVARVRWRHARGLYPLASIAPAGADEGEGRS